MSLENFSLHNAPVFKTPQEELNYLRESLKEKEKALQEKNTDYSKEKVTSDIIHEYRKFDTKDVVHKDILLSEKESDKLVLRLKPENHDSKMEELLGILLDKGISNALQVVTKMNNPHLDDDFHRFLVQYLHSTHKVPGLKDGSPLFRTLDMKLFEITLPASLDDESNKKV